MKLLLDTHTLLWLVDGNIKLTDTATCLLVDPNNELLLSPATYWELAIKVSIGKYRLADRLSDYIEQAIRLYGLTLLPISVAHAEILVNLPQHHKDPFDRMLIAQAIAEAVPLVSSDEAFDAYPVVRYW